MGVGAVLAAAVWAGVCSAGCAANPWEEAFVPNPAVLERLERLGRVAPGEYEQRRVDWDGVQGAIALAREGADAGREGWEAEVLAALPGEFPERSRVLGTARFSRWGAGPGRGDLRRAARRMGADLVVWSERYVSHRRVEVRVPETTRSYVDFRDTIVLPDGRRAMRTRRGTVTTTEYRRETRTQELWEYGAVFIATGPGAGESGD